MNKTTQDRSLGLTLRPLTPKDSIHELTEVINAAFAMRKEQGLQYAGVNQNAAGTRRRIKNGECYVAIVNERIVGTGTIHPPGSRHGNPWYRHPRVARFSQLAVHPDYRGQGIARELLWVCEARAVEMGAAAICLDTSEYATELIEYFERCGYKIVDRMILSHTNYPSVILCKHVDNGRSIRVSRLKMTLFNLRQRVRRVFGRLPLRLQALIARLLGKRLMR